MPFCVMQRCCRCLTAGKQRHAATTSTCQIVKHASMWHDTDVCAHMGRAGAPLQPHLSMRVSPECVGTKAGLLSSLREGMMAVILRGPLVPSTLVW